MADLVTTTQKTPSDRVLFIRRLFKRKTVAAGIIVLAVFAILALLAPWIAPYSPSKLSIVNRLKPPSEMFWFGTDEFGRDVFSRTIYAGRLSLMVGVAVVVLSALIGVTLGLLAGFFQRLDTPIARLIDAMMAFPDILLAIALVAALGPSLATVIIALSVVYSPRLARIDAGDPRAALCGSGPVARNIYIPHHDTARAQKSDFAHHRSVHIPFCERNARRSRTFLPRSWCQPRNSDLGDNDSRRAPIYRSGRLDDLFPRLRHHSFRPLAPDGWRRTTRHARSKTAKGFVI